MKLLSHVRLLATPWTAAYQAPPSMGFSRQESWSGMPLPSPQLALVGPKGPEVPVSCGRTGLLKVSSPTSIISITWTQVRNSHSANSEPRRGAHSQGLMVHVSPDSVFSELHMGRLKLTLVGVFTPQKWAKAASQDCPSPPYLIFLLLNNGQQNHGWVGSSCLNFNKPS